MASSQAGPSRQLKKRLRTARISDQIEYDGDGVSNITNEVSDPLLASDDEGGGKDEVEDSLREAPSTGNATKRVKKSKKGKATPGIVYISRLPPGMTPQKVRHLMARWGEVGKVYAQRRDAPSGYNPNANGNQKKKHQRADFTEAWVEFLNKSIAKTVAQMLNAQTIGGKKGDRWRDDVWTMRYLSGFKWEMLGEQVAYERQAHQARLRNEITRSKTEQGEYLRNVELARVLEKRKQRKAAAGTSSESAGKQTEGTDAPAGDAKPERKGYTQRQAIDRAKKLPEAGMEGVLSNVFS